MAKLTAQQWMDKWSRRMSAAGPDIQSGVARVQTAPGVSAAAASSRMLAGVTAAINNGTWQARVSAVPLSAWQSAMTTKGLNRINDGVQQASKTKVGAIQTFLSAVDAAVSDTNTLPKGSLEQNIARSAAFQRSMAARAPKRQK